MLRVVETFSGIGSQAKALRNIGIEHRILATLDWDINAIIAYDIIHNGKPELSEYKKMSKKELVDTLWKFTLSSDGKKPITYRSLKALSKQELEHLLAAIKRSRNLTSITKVNGVNLEKEIDLLTYSFPCQDLSIARAWHGESGGIDRDADNRSGMLWEVERILFERKEGNLPLPKFLLMENVINILSKKHKGNFEEWQGILIKLGYVNKTYVLGASDFGIPQNRKRAFMISVFCGDNDKLKSNVENYFSNNDLSDELYRSTLNIDFIPVEELLRVNYTDERYRNEANTIQPNDTESRRKIYDQNDLIYDGKEVRRNLISTITTKQDRNPNAGVLDYDSGIIGKSKFRYLTPRECFLFMGFEEQDYQALVDNDFYVPRTKSFFTSTKLYKFAGNSIVVNILEYIFRQIDDIDRNILSPNNNN